ncbi:MAG: hypothetical protein VXW87_03395 [Pseudomonadota bacterium]|nr:hypothetical protein [Pseudomonadota bacterium]
MSISCLYNTYHMKHPKGAGGNYNVIYLGKIDGEHRFGGMFPVNHKKWLTYNEIIEMLVKAFNEPQVLLGQSAALRP